MRYFKHSAGLFYQELSNGVLLVAEDSITVLGSITINQCSGFISLIEISQGEFNEAFENALQNINHVRNNLKIAI